nr:Rpp14/Pop5 family protein [Candidatus Njordarchaeota archaeon]
MKQTRRRYIAFEVSKTSRVDDSKSSLVKAIFNGLRERSTTEGYLRGKLQVIEYDPARAKGIIRIVPHTAVEEMKKLILAVDEVSGHHVETRILGTSGTLRATRRRYMKYQK